VGLSQVRSSFGRLSHIRIQGRVVATLWFIGVDRVEHQAVGDQVESSISASTIRVTNGAADTNWTNSLRNTPVAKLNWQISGLIDIWSVLLNATISGNRQAWVD